MQNQYEIIAMTVRNFIPGKEPRILKNGEERESFIPMTRRYVYCFTVRDRAGNPIQNGLAWKYTSGKKGFWTDSRDGKRLTDAQFREEIVRITSPEHYNGILNKLDDVVKASEVRDILAQLNEKLIPEKVSQFPWER